MSASLTILDVGHGNSAVVRGPDGVLVIDAGPGGGDLLQHLRNEEIERVDCVVISHADDDHLRGLIAILEEPSISVGEVRLNPDAAKLTALWEDVAWSLSLLDREGDLDFTTACVQGDTLPTVHDSLEVVVLGPVKELAAHGPGWTDKSGDTATTNSCSVVIRLLMDGQPVAILAGDIDSMGLDYLSRGHDELSAPLVVFPHHGGNVGRASSAAANVAFTHTLLEKVQPETVIFSIGRGQHGTPRPEIVDAVRAYGAGTRIACTQLSEHCRRDPLSEEDPMHLLDMHARGRRGYSCCAGSLRVNLGGDLEPDRARYEYFKSVEAPSALCLQATASQPPEG